jgi:hypothetical protein
MRYGMGLFGLVLALAGSAAYADLLPAPDRGPTSASAGGLDFAIQPVQVKYPGGYSKTLQVVVLTGCVQGQPNCKLAQARNLIGMEVDSVDGASLQPEKGMIQQIVDAFTGASTARTVTLELYSRTSNAAAITVSFARH